MTTVKALRDWLMLQNPQRLVAIDNRGMTLVVYQPDTGYHERLNLADDPTTASNDDYFEVGGVPLARIMLRNGQVQIEPATPKTAPPDDCQ